jgi:hypothetical protein
MKSKLFSVFVLFAIITIGTVCCDNGGGTAEHVHQWGEWVQTKAPTTTAEGVETRTCTLDPSHKETRPMAKHTHQWGSWTVTSAAACTTMGVETRVCTLDATHKETRPLAAIGHDWGGWAQTKAQTATAQGEETRTCKLDAAHKETRKLPYTIYSVAELGTLLSSQPANTATTAYSVKLNTNDISGIRDTLNNATNKYVSLDLSGSTITTIRMMLFYDSYLNQRCTTLTGIILPDSVTSIGGNAFSFCANLASVTIPSSVTSIGNGVFSGCTSLIEINVDAGNSAFSSLDDILYNKNKTTLIVYPGGTTGAITRPNSFTNIGS